MSFDLIEPKYRLGTVVFNGLPDGRTVFFYPPAKPDVPLLFRKKLPAELHPNGRSFVSMSSAGEVIAAVDDTLSAPGVKATHAIYPLHAGKTGGEIYRVLVATAGVLPAVFFVTGFMLWRMRRQVGRNRDSHRRSTALAGP